MTLLSRPVHGNISAAAGIDRQRSEVGGHDVVFGRTDVMRTLGLTASPASELLKKMLQLGLTEAVTGKGKGKYVFRKR